MFRLTNKLAVSNLIKNRKLYYPFALAVLLAVTVTYLFYSLTFNPKIAEIRGGTTIQATLGFGMFVVTLASAIIVLYANSFVMKNRSKELGIYGMLGLEKRHLISMTFKELVLFGILTFRFPTQTDEIEGRTSRYLPDECCHCSTCCLRFDFPRPHVPECSSNRAYECPPAFS